MGVNGCGIGCMLRSDVQQYGSGRGVWYGMQ